MGKRFIPHLFQEGENPLIFIHHGHEHIMTINKLWLPICYDHGPSSTVTRICVGEVGWPSTIMTQSEIML